MKNQQGNSNSALTIIVGFIIAISILRSCTSKSETHNGYHSTDAEMNVIR